MYVLKFRYCYIFQVKNNVVNLETTEKTLHFLKINTNKFDRKDYFIFILKEERKNLIENFLTQTLIQQTVNSIVINIVSVNSRSIYEVYFNAYFRNNKRVDPISVGKFIDGKFIPLNDYGYKGFFPDKMKNLENFKFEVSAFNYPPKVHNLF